MRQWASGDSACFSASVSAGTLAPVEADEVVDGDGDATVVVFLLPPLVFDEMVLVDDTTRQRQGKSRRLGTRVLLVACVAIQQ
jgi:hypothetical protein